MKKLLLIIAVLFYGFTNAQPFIPMLDELNEWSVDFNGIDGSIRTDQIQIEGEVLINGVLYKVVDGYGGTCNVREDNGIVYFLSYNGTEVIMYDFTLDLGDTFTFPLYSCLYGTLNAYDGLPFEVTNIEIQNIAGEDRKVIELKDDLSLFTEYWIEGIGSFSGFDPHNEYIDEGLTSLVCVTIDGTTYFFNGATSCDNTALDINDFSSEEIILHPNPVTNTSILQLPEAASIDRIKIYDLTGKLIKEEFISEDYFTVEAINYGSGLYFYQVFSDNNLVKTAKFIVK